MITRREFIDSAVVGIAGAAIASTTHSYAQILGTNERVNSATMKPGRKDQPDLPASKTIGLIVPDLSNRFFAEVSAGISDALTRHGYGLVLSSSRNDAELESAVIRQMLARNVDALVVAASCESHPAALKLAAREVPLVLLDRRIADDPALGFVGTDDVLAGELATQHLVDIGRRRIAYIGAPFSTSSDREQAYRAVLSRNQIEVPREYLVKIPANDVPNHMLGEKYMQKLLTLNPRPDAVFCYNDQTAWGAMGAILDAGLRIPEDIAVLGCGNTSYNSLVRVPLTSIDQNTASLGSEAAEMLFRAIKERLHKREHVPASVLLMPTLVVRKSTAGASPLAKARS